MENVQLPPQAVELERTVLGAILLEQSALVRVIDLLRPEMFYHPQHQYIYEAIVELFNNTQPVDLLTVTEQLRKNGNLEKVGGTAALLALTQDIANTANVEYYARIIQEKYLLREMIRISNETIKKAYDPSTDVFDLLDTTEHQLFTLSETYLRRDVTPVNEALLRFFEELQKIRAKKDHIIGVPSGFMELDLLTSGWQKGDLIIIAARPSMGKTAFALNIARNAAVEYGYPVVIFSLEMPEDQLTQRLLSAEAEINAERLRRAELSDQEFQLLWSKAQQLQQAPIYIDDTPALSIFDLRARARRLKADKNIALIVIDYLQLLHGPPNAKRMNREQEVAAISRSLKALAKELNIPVIALSQLNRAPETRGGDKRPMLSDLRESGAIEQDADLVIFIHRPEYYGFETDEQGNPTEGIAEIIIAKHRNGPTQTIRLEFVKNYVKFKPLTPFSHPKIIPSKANQYLDTPSSESNEDVPF